MQVLNSLDCLISLETRKIDHLKRYRQYVAQGFFPCSYGSDPQLRFPEFRHTGHWSVVRLGDIFSERKSYGGDGLDLLSVSIDLGVFRSSDLRLRRVVRGDLSKYKRVYPGDIIYNPARLRQGACGVSYWHGITSPEYVVLVPTKTQSAIFWSYWMQMKLPIAEFTRYSQRVAPDKQRLYYRAFREIVLPSPPSTLEQQKIANFITVLDTTISLKERKIKTLRALKNALIHGRVAAFRCKSDPILRIDI